MCGICGVLNKNDEPADRKVIRKMCDALYHRGPDDEGLYCNGSIGMGMRRLSIIDLNTGRQPIHNEEKSVWVVLNGEIYNYQELKQSLAKQGHTFYTKSDTEVIVHLYEEYGEDCVQFLRGMYSFAIWDNTKRQLILARDRVGIKPLFYYEDSKHLIFGSEIKSLLQHPRIYRELDMSALDHYFSLLYIPAPRTIYKSIKKLYPGHILVANNVKVEIKKYWELRYKIDHGRSLPETVEMFNSKFEEAVKIRLVSDVPLGALLSGGIDSSSVVAAMSKYSNGAMNTFTVGYPDADFFDETSYANHISELLGTKHYKKIVQPDIREILPEVIQHFDEPFADASAIPNYYIYQFAREHVTVLLSGLGGDEIAAGYPRYVALSLSKYFDKMPKIIREKWLTTLVKRLPDSRKGYRFFDRVKRFANSDNEAPHAKYRSYITFLQRFDKAELYIPDALTCMNGEIEALVESYFDQYSELDYLNRALFTDLKMYLPDDLLTLTDRMSMAHSLEVRVPFLDHELLEFMATVPPQYKLRLLTKKYIFKKAFKNILPKEILFRPKKGFSLPLAIWFRSELNNFVRESLSQKSIESIGILNYKKIADMLDLHFKAKENYYTQIWALIIFSKWYQFNFHNCFQEV